MISPLALEEAEKLEKERFDFCHAVLVLDSSTEYFRHKAGNVRVGRTVFSLKKLPDKIHEDANGAVGLVLAEKVKCDLLLPVVFLQNAVYKEGCQHALSCARSSKQPETMQGFLCIEPGFDDGILNRPKTCRMDSRLPVGNEKVFDIVTRSQAKYEVG
jgi:hypothetical protein